MEHQLTVYLAADTVMYLPIYVANEKGLFSTLIPDTEVVLKIAKGDADAISLMCSDVLNTDNKLFSVAIADPNVIQEPNVKVIGALIDRLAFWGVSTKDINCHKKGIQNKDFKKLVYYGENLYTGNRIGESVSNKVGIKTIQTISKVGDEFSELKEGNLIISPDILGIAKHVIENKAYINYRFSAFFNNKYMPSKYITTAIMTHDECIKDKTINAKLVKFIEAIQKAKSIIYSSEIIATEIIQKLDCLNEIDESKRLAISKKIVEIIDDKESKFYSDDMNVLPEQWAHTNNGNLKFEEYINNEIVLAAEHNISDQFGINLETFASEIKKIKEEAEIEKKGLETNNEKLKAENERLKAENEKLKILSKIKEWIKKNWLTVLVLLCLSYIIVWLLSRYVFQTKWTNSFFSKLCLSSIAFPILLKVIPNKQNKNEK